MFEHQMQSLYQKTILQRTGYKAKDGDKIIDGCGECSANSTVPGIMKIAPGHVCTREISGSGTYAIILDPFNIPEWCPVKIKEVPAQ